MAIRGFTDIGAGHKALTVDHDPRVVATDCPKGSILVDSDGCHYRKIDNGATTNVVDVGRYNIHETIENTVSTTDATVTTIATIPIPDDCTVLVDASVAAFRTNGEDQAMLRRVVCVYRRTGADVVKQGSSAVAAPVRSDGTWDISFSASGTNLLVRVLGAVGKDIDWKCRHTVESTGT